jgi:hypothetical protein
VIYILTDKTLVANGLILHHIYNIWQKLKSYHPTLAFKRSSSEAMLTLFLGAVLLGREKVLELFWLALNRL